MSIAILAIIPPFLWAIVNHVDKFLLSKAKHESSVNTLMLYSTFFSIVIIPIIYFFAKDQLFLNKSQLIYQVIGGLLVTSSIYFYLKALFIDEASNVIPLALLTPIFGFFLSYVFIGEILNVHQIISCIIIVIGSLILSLEFNEDNSIKIKKGVILLMILCSFFQASQEVLFKITTMNNSFIVSIFWLHVGILIFGIILSLLDKKSFQEFSSSLKESGKLIFSVNIISELTSSLAYIIRDYSLILAPVAIVMTLNSYQPAFVFILGIILTKFYPNLVNEKISTRHLIHKASAIAIMIFGTIFLNNFSL